MKKHPTGWTLVALQQFNDSAEHRVCHKPPLTGNPFPNAVVYKSVRPRQRHGQRHRHRQIPGAVSSTRAKDPVAQLGRCKAGKPNAKTLASPLGNVSNTPGCGRVATWQIHLLTTPRTYWDYIFHKGKISKSRMEMFLLEDGQQKGLEKFLHLYLNVWHL